MFFPNLLCICLIIAGRLEYACHEEECSSIRKKIEEKKENSKLKSLVKSFKEKLRSKSEENMSLSR